MDELEKKIDQIVNGKDFSMSGVEIMILANMVRMQQDIIKDRTKDVMHLTKELEEYRAAAALNSSGVNLYKENKHLKQVIEYTKSLLVELKKETEFAHIQTMIGYIEKLEKVAKK